MSRHKQNVLHITFNMGIGGAEQVIRQIVENSNADQFIHEVLCIDGATGALGQGLIEAGFRVEVTNRKPGIDVALISFIRRMVKERSIDILHCHQYSPFFYGVLGSIGTSARVIFTEHGRFYPDRHRFKRRLINPLLALETAHITAISHATANAVALYEYINRDKIEVIYNGISDISGNQKGRKELATELGLSPKFRYVGTVSRLDPIKNQIMMIKAYDKIRSHVSDVRLVIVGDGDMSSELKQLSSSLGIGKDVIFTGFNNNPQRYVSLFEVYLLSSFSEGTSITLLEAMSLSRPCVVTDVGGNPEVVITGKTGSVVPNNDTNAFAESIMHLLTDDKIREEYGQAGRNRFLEYFSVDRMIENYQRLYRE